MGGALGPEELSALLVSLAPGMAHSTATRPAPRKPGSPSAKLSVSTSASAGGLCGLVSPLRARTPSGGGDREFPGCSPGGSIFELTEVGADDESQAGNCCSAGTRKAQVLDEEKAGAEWAPSWVGEAQLVHGGWRPPSVLLDGPDVRRLAEAEAALLAGQGDAAGRARGCALLAAVARDSPAEVLLERPTPLRALLSALAAPATEALAQGARGSTSGHGGGHFGGGDGGGGRVFEHLLDVALDAVGAVAAGLAQSLRRQKDASLLGGPAAARATAAARQAVAEEAARTPVTGGGGGGGGGGVGGGGGGGGGGGSLWSPVLMRYPSLGPPEDRALELDRPPVAATPLSAGGAALLLLRALLPLAAGSNLALAARALAACRQLVPLLAEPRGGGGGDGAGGGAAARALTCGRAAAVLAAVVGSLDATAGFGGGGRDGDDSPSLGALEAARAAFGDQDAVGQPGALPLVLLLHLLLASGRVLPTSWITGGSGGGAAGAAAAVCGPSASLAVRGRAGDWVEALACCAPLRQHRPGLADGFARVLGAARPGAAADLEEALALARAAAPCASTALGPPAAAIAGRGFHDGTSDGGTFGVANWLARWLDALEGTMHHVGALSFSA